MKIDLVSLCVTTALITLFILITITGSVEISISTVVDPIEIVQPDCGD